MKKLLVYMKDYKKESILGPLFKLLEASFELLVPLSYRRLSMWALRTGMYLISCVWCCSWWRWASSGWCVRSRHSTLRRRPPVGFTAKVRSALFAHIQSLSYTEMDTMGTSTLITRMTSDMNQVQNGVNLVLRLFLRSPFIVFGAMIMAFTIDVKSAMVFVVTIPALSVVVFGVMLISMPLYKKVQAGLDRVLRRTRENLSGVRVIRAFNKEESEIQQFDEENRQLTKMQMFVGRISALMNPITYVIINVATLVLIWTGAWQVEGGILTQGQVVALVNYMSQILVELIKLANLVITVTKAWACANRIESIFDQQSSMQYPKQSVQEDPIADVITFENVGLTYKNAGAESLSNLNFSIHRGQTVGIIGGTGAGKTSLVNLIPRFYDASQGRVLVNGVDVREYPQDQLRDKIGIVPQKAVLFGGSIADNLRWGKEDATREELMDALRISQAEEFVEKREGGIDAMVAQNGKNLSGGQRQRLTIARALVRKPEILILDDSASALDYATDAKLRKAIRQMDPSVTVLIVSQRAASIQYADQIIVLDDGEAVGIGTHQELLQNCPVYQEIYYSQFPKEVQA